MLESRAFSVPPGFPRIRPDLCGAVAQLGERRVRNAKVEGSIPFRSTIFPCPGTCPQGARPALQYFSRNTLDFPNVGTVTT